MAWNLLPAFTISSRGGVCSVCGTEGKVTPEEGVLSPGIDIEFEGDFDICVSCVKEGARMVGMLDPDVLAEMTAERDALRAYADEMYALAQEQEATIEGLKRAIGEQVAPAAVPA